MNPGPYIPDPKENLQDALAKHDAVEWYEPENTNEDISSILQSQFEETG